MSATPVSSQEDSNPKINMEFLFSLKSITYLKSVVSDEKKLSNGFGFIRILCENVELSEIAYAKCDVFCYADLIGNSLP